jgi:hypothetical protein
MIELLKTAGLTILRQEGKFIDLAHGYRIEIENEALFKLLHEGSVVAPFDDAAELIQFIKLDMQLNGLS